MPRKDPEWIHVSDARLISGHASNAALRVWLNRWNAKPDVPHVKRRYGKVEKQSLIDALEYDAQKHATLSSRATIAYMELRRSLFN